MKRGEGKEPGMRIEKAAHKVDTSLQRLRMHRCPDGCATTSPEPEEPECGPVQGHRRAAANVPRHHDPGDPFVLQAAADVCSSAYGALAASVISGVDVSADGEPSCREGLRKADAPDAADVPSAQAVADEPHTT